MVNAPYPATAAEVKAWRQLLNRSGREAHRQYLAEGEHLCQEALAQGQALMVLVAVHKLAKYRSSLPGDIPVMSLTARQFQQISDTRTPQGIAALCPLPENATLKALGDRVVALNALQDPGNVGTILRSMDASGFTGLLVDGQSADAFSPKVLRAAMGAGFRIPVRRVDTLVEDLGQLEGHARIAGALDGQPFYARPAMGERICLIIGNEGAGIDPQVANLANWKLRLPMPGQAESLNAAVAASIMMYDFVRVWQTPDAGEEPCS